MSCLRHPSGNAARCGCTPGSAGRAPHALRSWAPVHDAQDSRSQITAYVFDEVRATVPRMVLDDVFMGG